MAIRNNKKVSSSGAELIAVSEHLGILKRVGNNGFLWKISDDLDKVDWKGIEEARLKAITNKDQL